MQTAFLKMHGAGNDFIVIDERAGTLGLTQKRIAALADRRTGIGCDQFIVLRPAVDADVTMGIYNPDGGEAGACGNATRCVASVLFEETGRRQQLIRTIAGGLAAEMLPNGLVTVDMGLVHLGWQDIPLAGAMGTLHLDLPGDPAAASMGNPHITFFDTPIDQAPVIGPRMEVDPMFPERTNVGFAQILAPDRMRLRVWERTAGLTLACGSGACAALVNAHRRGLTGRRAAVIVDGGVLEIAWRDDDHVLMTGPVATAYHGTVDLSAYAA
jgi:diaminopimelate epimerase